MLRVSDASTTLTMFGRAECRHTGAILAHIKLIKLLSITPSYVSAPSCVTALLAAPRYNLYI